MHKIIRLNPKYKYKITESNVVEIFKNGDQEKKINSNSKLYLKCAISRKLNIPLKEIQVSWYFLNSNGITNQQDASDLFVNSSRTKLPVYAYLNGSNVVGLSNQNNLEFIEDIYTLNHLKINQNFLAFDTEFLQIYNQKHYLQVGACEFSYDYKIIGFTDIILNPIITQKTLKSFNRIFEKYARDELIKNTINELVMKQYDYRVIKKEFSKKYVCDFNYYDIKNNRKSELVVMKQLFKNKVLLVWGAYEEEVFLKKYGLDIKIYDVQKLYSLFILKKVNQQISLSDAYLEVCSDIDGEIVKNSHNAVTDSYMIYRIVKELKILDFLKK